MMLAARWPLALGLGLVATNALANPLDEFGFGAQAIGLGGAVTALSVDFAALYYNPAGLAASDALRLELGYAYTEPFLSINGNDVDVDPSRGLQGGLVVPAELFGHRLAVSIGVFLPDDRVSRIRALPQSQPRFVLYDNRPQRLWVSAGGAVEVYDDIYVGATLTFLTDTKGTLDINGTVNATSVEHTRLFSAVDVELSAVRYPTFGVLWTPGDWRFGVVYRDEFILRLDIEVKVRGEITLGEEELVLVEAGSFALRALNHNLFSPRQVVAGAAYEGDGWRVALDLAWLQWSRFQAPASSIEIELDLGELDFAIPPPVDPEAPNFHDIVVPRIGAEYTVLDSEVVDLTTRLGYFFEASPAPAQPGLTNYVDGDEHGIGAGLGIALHVAPEVLPKPIVIDVAAQWIIMVPRTYTKVDPADPVGDFTAGGHFFGGAVTTRFLF